MTREVASQQNGSPASPPHQSQADCGCGHDHAHVNPASGEPLIQARDLTVEFGGRVALDQVNLTVHRNEIVTLIGPNGAGKSTLIRALLQAIKPNKGDVWRRHGLVIGYVPQRLNIDPIMPMTVKRFLSIPSPHSLAECKQALHSVGADQTLEQPVQSLSGGEFQRVLLARAILRKPDLLVLDEPVQGVDFQGQTELYRLISRLRERNGFGILMVSHDLHIVMAETDRVVCINGHVCCSGAPTQVSDSPEYLALFGGQTKPGLAVYHHLHDHTHDGMASQQHTHSLNVDHPDKPDVAQKERN
ncbi:metal ABC transporter ATP-binding protein [Kiloniella laminariae]|uniref:Metal ABC transporter ATP-binding protein n=1 Tax=Kiloniella laminariae TaxID=454162 RepID=A0ABT4LPI7_9PROT|nr:metal ABC transporter ATP-binding protein [Kiloniella laminariae]MCZ4282810.1 metal ABC transporter ATP-binding protein [Kiloniella laminariae]